MTDEPILDKSRDELKKYSLPEPDIILTSPLRRCIETAEVLFPGRATVPVDGFRECDFGQFEYMNYAGLNGNPDYQRYIDSGGSIPFPGGEDRKSFQDRCVRAFFGVMCRILEHGNKNRSLALVVHGGTIMALMDYFAVPHMDYFDWHVGNGEGYEAWLDCSCDIPEHWEFRITGAKKTGGKRTGNTK